MINNFDIVKIVVNTNFILFKYFFNLSRMLKRYCENIFISIVKNKIKMNVEKTIVLFVMIDVFDNFNYYFQIKIIECVMIFVYVD